MSQKALQDAATWVKERMGPIHPRCALVLGSGWGEATKSFTVKRSLTFSGIPFMSSANVAGHALMLHLVQFEGAELLVFQGRRHWYEGDGWNPVALPVLLCLTFGVSVLILTNASGGIRSDLKPGDLLVIDDHINLMGVSPLVGKHEACWGPRFPDQSEVYDRQLRAAMDAAGARAGLKLPHGVYAATSGPAYETPAEVVALRTLGADAVGMSTVPEAMLAHAAGLRVAAISCVANLAAGLSTASLSHEDILAETRRNQEKMAALLVELLKDSAVRSPPQ